MIDISSLRAALPEGTVIRAIRMVNEDGSMDSQAVPIGTYGKVSHIDDVGTIHMNWDTGSTLGILPGVDDFMVIGKNNFDKCFITIIADKSRISSCGIWNYPIDELNDLLITHAGSTLVYSDGRLYEAK